MMVFINKTILRDHSGTSCDNEMFETLLKVCHSENIAVCTGTDVGNGRRADCPSYFTFDPLCSPLDHIRILGNGL